MRALHSVLTTSGSVRPANARAVWPMDSIWADAAWQNVAMDGLSEFIVTAKRATYASGASKSLPYRLATSDLQFHQGVWSYHDSYVGEADFLGQELVYRDRVPVWSMAYYGYLLDPEKISAAQAGHTVQSALTRLYAEGRFLGGFVADLDDYRYVDINSGDVERFTGEEWIERRGQRVYELRYFGGLIKY